MELVNEWFPTGKFRKVDKPFRTDSTNEKDLMVVLKLTRNELNNTNRNIMESVYIILEG